ncbi:MAG: VWA domain-containing protein [Planctomycetes bacterium]|nr:VWA domain-containing protein [Planctomycetota bacterium]
MNSIMSGWEIGFDKPWFLLLLGLLPILWVASFRSLAGLGPFRRIFALSLRSIVLLLFVFALAEVQLKRTSEKIAVVFVIDMSDSVPRETHDAAFEYVKQTVAKYRDQDRQDLAGVVVFGGLAKVDHQPIDEDIVAIGESVVDWTDSTNLADALKVAHALFTDEAAKRIVVVSDGNENIGDAKSVARMLADEGIGIDVVAVNLTARAEIAVEKITTPVDLRKGQVFEMRVVVNNFADPKSRNVKDFVAGTLTVTQHTPSGDRVLAEKEVTLAPGKNVFTVPHRIDRAGMSTFHAQFVPTDPAQDLVKQNNMATAYTHVRGKGHVLFIEDGDPEFKGEFNSLIKRLREQNLDVTVMDTTRLFDTAADLLEFDTVVLGNVPRSSGDPEQGIVHFSDENILALVRNTEQMGCGLVMIGGPNSFGAGGWTNTELEKAMPVDFQIRNSKIRAIGALVLMMHCRPIFAAAVTIAPAINCVPAATITLRSIQAVGWAIVIGLSPSSTSRSCIRNLARPLGLPMATQKPISCRSRPSIHSENPSCPQ